jgi:lysophospholipase L1-like esterase
MVTVTLRAMSRLPAIAALGCAAALCLPAAAPAATKSLYVSLGDSYATGYQATGVRQGKNTRNGFAYQLPKLAAKRGYELQLVNFGCGGATTTSLLRQTAPCSPRGRGPGGRGWGGRTQVAAAERFLRANRGDVALVTISVGGNDVTKCARHPDPVPCVADAVEDLKKNVTTIARRVRAAAGRDVRIVGITYPDVILGQWVGTGANQDLARLSVVAFQSLINPALKQAYESARGRFVDVTAATGAYTRLDQTIDLPPYGRIPVAVANVCDLTYYCAYRDIHAKTDGYRIIADLIARTLPRRG